MTQTLVDTHCHMNMMVKTQFDIPLTQEEIINARAIILQASEQGIEKIINVGTSLTESKNCIALAQTYDSVYAAIGIHPNDLTTNWRQEISELSQLISITKPGIIVAVGECGIDKHYPDYDLARQQDAFRAQIELALEHNLPLIVHTRQAPTETLACLSEYKNKNLRGVIHCFSEDLQFAQDAIALGFVLGIGGTITYPKNEILRTVVKTVPLEKIILETDAPFLPIQSMRGKQNAPRYIAEIANYLAELRNTDLATVAQTTTNAVHKIFGLHKS